ncbi:LysR family transcriptional regulator [Bradyrhizobium zhanjiangense]|uniref:LysR family transcriptional regulator n=2 Tax=Bradyrhizobium zhanjiangense TaxID=1325107 RepID=A0ABY0D8L3_9BRAD|nr:LysR family transcriptional regulator [Bradyrhizobium zhanjiangense]
MRIFVRVVEAGSFSRAASDLSLTQPAVTKHVAAIERALNVQLLNRNTRGIHVTEIGALYYERCKAVLHEIALADELIDGKRRQVQGLLRVTTSVALGRRIIAPLVVSFVRTHPHVRIDLSCEDRYVDLIAQGVDLAVRMGRLADSTYGARRLGFNPWVVIASPDYLARRGEPKSIAELERHECLVYSTVQGDDVWQMTLPNSKPAVVPVRGCLRSNNLATLLQASEAGLGIASLPHYVACEALTAGRVRRILGDHAPQGQEVHAVFPSPKHVPAKASLFVDALIGRFSGEWWLAQDMWEREPARPFERHSRLE